jgi:hypothetical protein
MKTFKQYFEAYANATGRWGDFEIKKKLYQGKLNYMKVPTHIRIYEGTRLGKTLFETQIKWKSEWRTIQYSTSFNEAMNPVQRDPFILPSY